MKRLSGCSALFAFSVPYILTYHVFAMMFVIVLLLAVMPWNILAQSSSSSSSSSTASSSGDCDEAVVSGFVGEWENVYTEGSQCCEVQGTTMIYYQCDDTYRVETIVDRTLGVCSYLEDSDFPYADTDEPFQDTLVNHFEPTTINGQFALRREVTVVISGFQITAQADMILNTTNPDQPWATTWSGTAPLTADYAGTTCHIQNVPAGNDDYVPAWTRAAEEEEPEDDEEDEETSAASGVVTNAVLMLVLFALAVMF